MWHVWEMKFWVPSNTRHIAELALFNNSWPALQGTLPPVATTTL